MSTDHAFLWKKAPFIRLFIPLVAGILLEWEFQLAPNYWWYGLLVAVLSTSSFFFIPLIRRYRSRSLTGLFISIAFIAAGALLTWYHNVRHHKEWIGNYYSSKDIVIATLNEPLQEKTNSFKAEASVNYILKADQQTPVKGKIIIYFQTDSAVKQLGYGSRILLKTTLQQIKNSGNPGAFDYKRYCLFQGITHQVFLKKGDYVLLNGKKENWFQRFLFATQEKVLAILRKNIKGEKELGLAEALLIGYKSDLDQTLVQSYTNTGVVHIIAISGLHLGLIYWLLLLLTQPLQKIKKLKWLAPLLIKSGIWYFSLL
jgi:competence protein ComEC